MYVSRSLREVSAEFIPALISSLTLSLSYALSRLPVEFGVGPFIASVFGERKPADRNEGVSEGLAERRRIGRTRRFAPRICQAEN